MNYWLKCKGCGKRYDGTLKNCPICNHKTPVTAAKIGCALLKAVAVVASVAVAVGAIYGVVVFFQSGDAYIYENDTTSNLTGKPNGDGNSVSSSVNVPVLADPNELGNRPDVSSNQPVLNGKYMMPSDTDGNVTIDQSGVVHITMPKWLLELTGEEMVYELDESEIAMKFTGVTKKSNGDAEYTIKYDDYHAALNKIGESVADSITFFDQHKDVWAVECSENAGSKNGFNTIDVYTTYSSIDELDDWFLATSISVGTMTTIHQFYNCYYSVGTDIRIYNIDRDLIAVSRYPDVLKSADFGQFAD